MRFLVFVVLLDILFLAGCCKLSDSSESGGSDSVAVDTLAVDTLARVIEQSDSITSQSDSVGERKAVEDSLRRHLLQVRTAHLTHYVFDLNYNVLSDSTVMPDTSNTKWVEWEDIFFNRGYFLERIADFTSVEWEKGIWWWQLSIRVEYDENLKRGDSINFVIDYPWVDFRDDLRLVAFKDKLGQTVIKQYGFYYPPRWSYFQSFFIMFITLIFAIVVLLAVIYGLFLLFQMTVNFTAEMFLPGQGNNILVRRVATMIVLAVLFFIIGVVAFFV